MLKSNKRSLTVAETLSSVLSGERVPSLYEITEEELHPAIRGTRFAVKPKFRQQSGLVVEEKIDRHCPFYAPDVLTAEWLSDVLLNKRGVVAATPDTELHPGRILAFDQTSACGHDRYWVSSIMNSRHVFNETKTSNALSPNCTIFEAITLQSSVPQFLPEGDAFGMERSDMDAFIDAGIKVEVRSKPYASHNECVSMVGKDEQNAACNKELGMLMEMATRGVAPSVIAAFYVRADTVHQRKDDSWRLYKTPNAKVEVKPTATDHPDVSALVLVSQLSTFTLNDLMSDIKSALVPARKDQLLNTLLSACGPVFKTINEMCKVHKGYGAIKLNMTPQSVVFCPSLVAVGGSWELEGTGYMPISESHLDGVPRITDFNAALSTKIKESSYSFETSYSMHCMLMVAFARALHGPSVADVLWKHLLAEGDPSGFVAASRAMQSRSTNASAFLACMAANTSMHYPAELRKAIADAVSDMDRVVRSGVVSKDGGISAMEDVSMFTKIVSVVTGSTAVDTHIFHRDEHDVEDGVEMEHLNALERVKTMRLARITSS